MKWRKRKSNSQDDNTHGFHSRKRNDQGKSGDVERGEALNYFDDPNRYNQHGHGKLPGQTYVNEQKHGRKRNDQGKSGTVARKGEGLNNGRGPVSGSRRQLTEKDRRMFTEQNYRIKRRKPGKKSISHADEYSDELYHYGVAGMKWGVRRYQNEDGSLTEAGRRRQARRYSRELNKKDKSTVRIKRTVKEAEQKADSFDLRAKRAVNTSKKLEFETKAKNIRNSVSEERKRIEQVDAEAKKLVDKIKREGYSVKSNKVIRGANRGSDYAKSIVVDIGVLSVAALAGAPYTPLFVPVHTVEGTKYKVTDKKKG